MIELLTHDLDVIYGGASVTQWMMVGESIGAMGAFAGAVYGGLALCTPSTCEIELAKYKFLAALWPIVGIIGSDLWHLFVRNTPELFYSSSCTRTV